MKRFWGWFLIAIAIIAGIYVGGWMLFIKPIVDIINAVIANCVTWNILIHVCKILILMPLSMVLAWLIIVIGGMILICADDETMMKNELMKKE